MAKEQEKFLVIRFSSFGDVVQSLSIPSVIKTQFPQATVHFVTRKEYSTLLQSHPCINKVWSLDRLSGLPGLIQLIKALRKERFTHVYDAHNNLRSRMIHWGLGGMLWFFRPYHFLRRSGYRWKRFLLFYLRINRYPKPFPGQIALIEPLVRWGIPTRLPPCPQVFFSVELLLRTEERIGPPSNNQRPLIALAPSSSYELKRWPLQHWQKLILNNPQWQFLLFGGPEDHFIQEIANIAPERTMNLAGRLSFEESSAAVSLCKALVSNDTGLMHIAEQLGMKCIALMGPAPFGYPGRATTVIKERELSCRPCSKHGQGPCTNRNSYQECLVSISPKEVANDLAQALK